jgi:hypothetical protein
MNCRCHQIVQSALRTGRGRDFRSQTVETGRWPRPTGFDKSRSCRQLSAIVDAVVGSIAVSNGGSITGFDRRLDRARAPTRGCA